MKLKSIMESIIKEEKFPKKVLFRDKATQNQLDKFAAKNPKLYNILEFFQTELIKLKLYGSIDFGMNEIIIEPKTIPSGIYDGMSCIFHLDLNEFEVVESQAGEKEDEMHIFTVTKSPKVALKSLLLGNKNRKPIKVWN